MLHQNAREFGFVFLSRNCHSSLMIQPRPLVRSVIAFALAVWAFSGPRLEGAAGQTLKLTTPTGYLPAIPVLVRVEVLNSRGDKDRSLWDSQAILSVDRGGITLSTNRVIMRNGLGSALVSIAGGTDFVLTASVGSSGAARHLRILTSEPITQTGGTLPGTATTWSGIIQITNDLTIPAGHTLTILSNTLVLVDGVASGTVAPDIFVSGTLQSLGTEDQPVTITCANPGLYWGQIRHNTSQPSLYRYTTITRGGRAAGEGHTGTAPVIRPSASKLVFESCNLTDYATSAGTPGKIMFAINSDLTFNNCLLSRARMGPEIQGTSLFCTNTYFMDMTGPDDADGIYLHGQGPGGQIILSGCVIAQGDDDGIDTLDSVSTVEDCIIRDWASKIEDAKGISAYHGAVHVRRCLITTSTVGISAKANAGNSTLVTIENSTLFGNGTNVLAQYKTTATGPVIDYRITNCVLWGAVDQVSSDFSPTNFTIGYCDISEAWPGTGNIMSDPLFINAAAKDFRLRPGSPCIDSGAPFSPSDPDGSGADMGYFVFEPPEPQLSNPALSAGAFRFLLNAYPGRDYVIESSANLPSWSFFARVPQTNASIAVSDSAPGVRKFYRAHLAP